jgi:hypothetical protein
MVEAPFAQPAPHEVLHDPGAPTHLQGLACQHDKDANGGHGGDNEREDEDGLGHRFHVATF